MADAGRVSRGGGRGGLVLGGLHVRNCDRVMARIGLLLGREHWMDRLIARARPGSQGADVAAPGCAVEYSWPIIKAGEDGRDQ
jgi:hypothetical protein